MVFVSKKCPDCGSEVTAKIRTDDLSRPFWECPECGVVHEDYSWFRTIKSKAAYDALKHTKAPDGLYVFDTDIEVIGIKCAGGELTEEEGPMFLNVIEWFVNGVSA